MGIAIPQVITSDRASGAQIVDGSLKLDSAKKTILHRIFSSGNNKTWTFSMWTRKQNDDCHFLSSGTSTDRFNAGWVQGTDKLFIYIQESNSAVFNANSVAQFRDNGWYHIVIAADTTKADNDDRIIAYVNGDRIYDWTGDTTIGQNASTHLNNATSHAIGNRYYNNSDYVSGMFAQTYLIDGQQLGPEYFGFTDPLTNTWKPKKYEGDFGTNGFYLPMDGNSPIGEDKSGVPSLNDGTFWSNSLTSSSGFRSSEPKFNAFDGDTSSICSAVNDGTITFTSPVTFASDSTIKVVVHGGDHTVTVNGGDDQTISAGSLQTVTYSNSSNATFIMTFKRDTSADTGVRAIEINGVILTDNLKGNSWTPVNFGGSVALDSRAVSGARPILNTTQGGTQAGVGVFGSRENIGYAVTVGDSSGSNKFYLDGVEAPTLSNLIRGVTYTFDQSDSSNGTHPLVFGSTAEGNNFARGALYGSISAGSAGAATTITIPYDAPETLYYHCSAHSGMGGSIVGIRTDETKADQYASNCTLALPLVGSDDDVCASIACTANNKTPTNSSVVASTAESNFYKGSHYWSANSDTLQYAEQGDELVFGTGDFTIECWVYDDDGHNGSGGRCYIFDNRIGGSEVGDPPTMVGYVDGSNEFNFYDGTNTISHTVPSTIGKWWHYAVTREGTTTRMFIDGILRGSATSSTDFTNNGIGVGRATDGGYGWAGYIQDFRVYRGLAKYTNDFVVPSTNPDVLQDTPSGVSGSSKLTKITEGAVSFGGSDDFLSIADNVDFTVGSNPFTIEFYAYKTESGEDMFCGSSNSSGSDSSTSYIVQTGGGSPSNSLRAHVGDGSSLTTVNSGIDFVLNKWVHIAFVRDGNTLRLFQDGIQMDTTSFTGTVKDSGEPFYIGRGFGANSTKNFPGFISNFRFIKGTALYTKNFTPPTAPLTNVTNTKLLCCQSNVTSAAAAASPNISGINDGTPWSSIVGGPTRIEDRVANAFKGSSGSPGAIAAYPGALEFRPGITGISTLAVRGYYAGSGVSLTVNDVAQSPSSGSAFDIGITTTRLDSVVWSAIDGFNYMRIDQIEIDGVALVDPVVGPDDSEEAATTFNPFNTDINTVRGQETGYPTMNPLAKNSDITLEDGNLRITQTDSHGQKKIVYSTAQIPYDGKWYVEWHLGGPAVTLGFGMNGKVEFRGSDTQLGTDNNSWGYEPNGNLFHNGNQGGSYGASSAGDVIGMTIDTSDTTITAQWYENGVLIRNSSGAAAEFTGIARSDYIVMMSQHTPNYDTVVNFGQKPFKFSPPDGFQPLNNANTRPVKVISRPDQYVGVMTYSGISTSGNVVNDLNFNSKPDFVWIKANSGSDSPSTQNHYLVDSVRGANGSVTKKLYSNSNGVENSGQTDANNGVNFIHNGFELTSDNDGTNADNGYVAWCWKAGGDKNTFNIDNVGYSTAGDANMGIADLNSSAYNTSQTWSDNVTGGDSAYGDKGNAFNGDLSNFASPEYSSPMTYTNPSPSDTTIETFEIYGRRYSSSITLQLNDVDISSQFSATVKWHTITGFTNQQFRKLYWRPTSSNHEVRIYAIRINGKVLVDDDVTPPNVPSIAASGCSVGTKQGFSIIKYTGTGTAGTISHGLSEQPKFVIIKDLKNTNSWAVQHVGTVLGTGLLKLDVTNAVDSSVASAVWNSTAPTSSVFSVGTAGDVNYTTNSAEYIAYLWHDVPGLQKFGVFKGNGNANGIFVELGFKPAILLIKNSDNTGDWIIWDSERNPHNPVNRQIWPYTTSGTYGDYDQVASNYPLDFLSNGFKMRTTDADMNDGSRSYIYCAWAEAPSANLFGGGANAR